MYCEQRLSSENNKMLFMSLANRIICLNILCFFRMLWSQTSISVYKANKSLTIQVVAHAPCRDVHTLWPQMNTEPTARCLRVHPHDIRAGVATLVLSAGSML